MLLLKQPVTGIDIPIQQLQTELFEDLLCAWKLDESEYQSYGRVYKIPVQGGGYIPSAYMSDGEYRDVMLDDAFAVQSFFGLGDITRMAGAYNVEQVHVIFFLNLGKIDTLPVRGDREARDVVQAILGQNLHGFTLESVTTRIESVLAEYKLSRRSGGQESTIKYADMHPWYAFRMNGTLHYPAPRLTN